MVPASAIPEFERQFGTAESAKWQEKASGCAFWTYKMEWIPGGEWGFQYATDNGKIYAPALFKLTVKDIENKLELAATEFQGALTAASSAHQQFWDKTSPGQPFEHWRYSDGYTAGWNDARDFFGARANTVIPSCGGLGTPDATCPTRRFDDNLVIGADTIGALDLWVLKRMMEANVADKAVTPFGWEREQRFRDGVKGFANAIV